MLTRDDFEEWLMGIDSRIDSLRATLPADVAGALDYSAGSLDALEEWLLSRYASTSDVIDESEKEMLDLLASYVGEAFRTNIGGIWNIDLEDERNVYFNIPVLEQNGKWRECPFTVVTAAADRRTGHYMSGVLRSYIARYQP